MLVFCLGSVFGTVNAGDEETLTHPDAPQPQPPISPSADKASDTAAPINEQIDAIEMMIMPQGFNEDLVRLQETNQYATTEDFCRFFNENLDELHHLAFLLTRDQETAEECFVAGLEDCVKANNVFREWARSWAKWTIIQLHPKGVSASASATVPVRGARTYIRGGHPEINRVLVLHDFERLFVFVMSVLVHYSEHDCAFLLSRALQEIREARVRAFQQIVGSRQTSAAREIINVLQETK